DGWCDGLVVTVQRRRRVGGAPRGARQRGRGAYRSGGARGGSPSRGRRGGAGTRGGATGGGEHDARRGAGRRGASHRGPQVRGRTRHGRRAPRRAGDGARCRPRGVAGPTRSPPGAGHAPACPWRRSHAPRRAARCGDVNSGVTPMRAGFLPGVLALAAACGGPTPEAVAPPPTSGRAVAVVDTVMTATVEAVGVAAPRESATLSTRLMARVTEVT